MKLITYPTSDYNSYISESWMDDYSEFRLEATEWTQCTEKEAALVTAFKYLQELPGLTIDPTGTTQLLVLMQAQAEQALFLLKNSSLDQSVNPNQVNLGGLLQVSFDSPDREDDSAFYSPRVLRLLKPYIDDRPQVGTITRTR